jgi:chromosome segregation ATPase
MREMPHCPKILSTRDPLGNPLSQQIPSPIQITPSSTSPLNRRHALQSRSPQTLSANLTGLYIGLGILIGLLLAPPMLWYYRRRASERREKLTDRLNKEHGEECRTLRGETANVRQNLERSQQSVVDITEAQERLRVDVNNARALAERRQRNINDLRDDLGGLRRELNEFRESRDELQREVTNLTTERDRLLQDMTPAARERARDIEGLLVVAQETIQRVQEQRNRANAALRETIGERDEARRQRSHDEQSRLEAIRDRDAAVAERDDAARRDRDAHRAQRVEAERELHSARDMARTMQNARDEAGQGLANMRTQLQGALDDARRAREDEGRLRETVRADEERIGELQREGEGRQRRIQELERRVAFLNDRAMGLAAQVRELERGRR